MASAIKNTLTLTEVAGSANAENNTSKIRILWESEQTGGYYNNNTREAYFWVSVNGGAEEKYSVIYNLPQGTTTRTVADKTLTIQHADDGTATVKVRTWMDTDLDEAGIIETSQTLELAQIGRASVLTAAADVTLGNKCSVKWTPMAAAFRYKLKFAMGEWSYTTGAIHPNQTSAYTYTGYAIPLETAKQIPDAKTGEMAVTLYTYSDSGATAQIGDAASATFTVTVPNNSETQPTVSIAVSPVSALPEAFTGLYIQGKTKVKVDISAEGKYGAEIVSSTAYIDGAQYGEEKDYTSGYLAGYGTIRAQGSVADTRGFTGSASEDIDVIPYSNPKILAATGESGVVASKCDAEGNLTEDGTYLKIKAKRSYSPVEADGVQLNFCQIRYRWKADGDDNYSEWVTLLAADAESNEVETGALLNGSLQATVTYHVQVGVLDDLGGTNETTFHLNTEKVYMHRNGPRNAMGLGKYVEDDNTLDVAWDIRARSRLILGEEGYPIVDFIVKAGTLQTAASDSTVVDNPETAASYDGDNVWHYKCWADGTYMMFGCFLVEVSSVTEGNGTFYTNPFAVLAPFEIDSALVAGVAFGGYRVMNGGISDMQDRSVGFRLERGKTTDVGTRLVARLMVQGLWHETTTLKEE